MTLVDDSEQAPTDEVTSPVAKLRDLAVAVIEATGTPHDMAVVVGHSLVESNVVGHDSHGVMRLARYVAEVRAGNVIPTARPRLENRRGNSAHVDASWGWGQPAARLATEQAIALARAHAVSAVTISSCNHIGRLGEHAAAIAAAGLIGIVLCNAEPVVAPFGGRGRMLGTNPVALACPRLGREPMVFDMATSAVAEGKLSVARSKGQLVDPGLLVDGSGQPSIDPVAFYDGGALLPFGGHKGYGLSVFVEILGGVLSGAGAASSDKYLRGNGTLVIALDPSAFMELSRFAADVRDLCERLTASAPAAEDGTVLAPGDLETATRRARLVSGIALPRQTWAELVDLAAGLGVDASLRPGVA